MSATMAGREFVRIEVANAIATVTLDRPPVNALSLPLCLEIADAFAEVNARVDEVRAAILTGEGRCFCAGRDNKVAPSEPPKERAAALATAMRSVFHCEVPVVAAVNGPAIGAGFRLVLLADVVVASSEASFSMPEIEVGLVPSIATLLRAFNQFQAREIAFGGGRYSAEDMVRMGLLRDVQTPDDLLSEARRLAGVLAAKSPLALRGAKWSANEVEALVADWERANRAIESRA